MAPPFFFASCPFISMSETTQGVRVQSGSRALRAGVELLSSMRFAISLLTVICIASVIGTVLKQHEPAVNYVNQFGPFWAELFGALQLNAVYSAWWFLLILAFLVVSTSLCIARNTPKFLSDIKSYKENVREQSLRAFHHKAEAALAEGTEAEARRIGGMLASGGWKVRLQQRETFEPRARRALEHLFRHHVQQFPAGLEARIDRLHDGVVGRKKRCGDVLQQDGVQLGDHLRAAVVALHEHFGGAAGRRGL